MDLIVGRNGIVTLRPTDDANPGQVYIPTHQPNYIGRNNRSADFGSLSFRLTGVKPNATRCTITVAGVAGSGRLLIRGKSGETTRSLSTLAAADHEFDLSKLEIDGELRLEVDSGDNREIGYVVIERIRVVDE